MFDTMTITKAAASVFGAFLVLLLGAWAAETIYHVGGHGKDHHQAYVIDTGESEESAEPEEQLDFATVFASADAGSGERLWRQCQSCHALEDGRNGTGPHLYNVVGRDKGAVDGYAYSEAMATQDGAWTPENLSAFLENPRDYTPGTKMSYSGMADIEDRANLIAYLETIGG